MSKFTLITILFQHLFIKHFFESTNILNDVKGLLYKYNDRDAKLINSKKSIVTIKKFIRVIKYS